MNIRSQRGDAMVVLIVALVVMVLAGLGYVAWRQYSNNDTATVPEATGKKQSEIDMLTDDDASYKGKRVVSHDGFISFKVPNGWEIYRSSTAGSASMMTTPMMGEAAVPVYSPDKEPVVITVDGTASHAEFGISIVDQPREDVGEKVSFTLNDGTKGTKVVRDHRVDSGDVDGDASDWGGLNWRYQTYTFVKNGKIAELAWAHSSPADAAADPALHAFIDDVARTIRFK